MLNLGTTYLATPLRTRREVCCVNQTTIISNLTINRVINIFRVIPQSKIYLSHFFD